MGLFGPPNIKKLEEKGKIQELLKILVDNKMDEKIRVAAGSALGRLHIIEAINPMIWLGTYGGNWIHEPLQDALLNIGAPAINPLIFSLRDNGFPKFTEDCLVRFGAQAVDPLIEALKSNNSLRVSQVLVKLGAPAFNAIVTLLTNPEPQLRARAGWILGKMRDVRAMQPLIATLSDTVPNVRENAIQALAALHSVEVIDPIIQCLNDSEPNIRKAAATALKSLHWKPTRDEAGAQYWIASGDYAKCASIGEPAVDALINSVKSTYHGDRINVIQTLAKIKDPRAIQAIIESLDRSGYEEQHRASIDALVQFGSSAVPLLLLALRHSDSTARRNIIATLGKIHDPRAIEPMVDLLLEESPSSEDKLKEVLLGFGLITVVPLAKAFRIATSIDCQQRIASLLSSLNWQPMDESTAITYYLLKGDFDRLTQMGDPAVRQLVSWLSDPNHPLHENSLEALKKIGSPAVESVLKILETSDRKLQWEVLQILETIADRRVVEPLLHFYETCDEIMQNEVCIILAKIGDQRALELILSNYPKQNDKLPIILAMPKFKDPRAVDLLINVFTENFIWSNGYRGEERNAYRAAIDGLAALGDPRAIPVTISKLAGADPEVCRAAARALDTFGWKPESPAEKTSYFIALKDFDGIMNLGELAVEPLVSFFLKNTYDLQTALKMMNSLRRLKTPEAIPAYILTLKNPEYELRKTAAQALIEIYQSGQISEQEKQLVLAQRTVIQAKHENHYESSDCSSHTDSGIGLSFPL